MDLDYMLRCIQLSEEKENVNRLIKENEELASMLWKAQKRIYELEDEIASFPRAGRPLVYDIGFRDKVREYYNAGHTYRDTAAHFNISQPTICKILRE